MPDFQIRFLRILYFYSTKKITDMEAKILDLIYNSDSVVLLGEYLSIHLIVDIK